MTTTTTEPLAAAAAALRRWYPDPNQAAAMADRWADADRRWGQVAAHIRETHLRSLFDRPYTPDPRD